ncbi:MAG: hypothetical protein ACYCR7_01040 [Thermoplasmataceae archaeon]
MKEISKRGFKRFIIAALIVNLIFILILWFALPSPYHNSGFWISRVILTIDVIGVTWIPVLIEARRQKREDNI